MVDTWSSPKTATLHKSPTNFEGHADVPGQVGVDYVWFHYPTASFDIDSPDYGMVTQLTECAVVCFRDGRLIIETQQNGRPGCITVTTYPLSLTLRGAAGEPLTLVTIDDDQGNGFQAEHRDNNRLWQREVQYDPKEIDNFVTCDVQFPSMGFNENQAGG